MNFISNMLGGGNNSASAAGEQPAAATTTNNLSLLGADSDVLLSDGISKVGGTATTVG